MIPAGADRRHATRQAAHVDGDGADPSRSPDAQLAEEVDAPTLDPTRSREGTGVVTPGADRGHAES